MNILIYLGHPAQYHFFKHPIRNFIADGHNVKVLIKTKDILEQLLIEDGIPYQNIQPKMRKNNKFSILMASVRRTLTVCSEAGRFKADILTGSDSSIAQAGWLLRKPAISVGEDDYEVIKQFAKLTYPFTSAIVAPEECNVGPYKDKKVPYEGYMKLAYLHPDIFHPDRSILDKYGLSQRFVLIRLAKLTAHHDTGIKGLNTDLVKDVIGKFEDAGYKAYITSETVIDSSLEKYRLKIHYSDIHHVLAYAGALISDSQSMSMEAAMLGVPSIRFSDFAGRISVLEHLEHHYGLTSGIPTSRPEDLCKKVDELLSIPDLHGEFAERRSKMLADKINVTDFFTKYIETYKK